MNTSIQKSVSGEGSQGNVRYVKDQPVPSWQPSQVELPQVSVGTCKGVKQCKEWRTELADGWCMRHWDVGRGL